MSDGPQFFICYDKVYQAEALRLHELLVNDLRGKFGRDIDVFIDRREIETAQDWLSQIDTALAGTELLIVLVNDGIITRPYCRYEFNTIRQRMDRGEACRILPVRFQRDSEIFQSAPLTQSKLEEQDRSFLDSLSADEKEMVLALRSLQSIDGADLRESPANSAPFNEAFLRLSAEVAKHHRVLGRRRTNDGARIVADRQEPSPPPTAPEGGRRRTPIYIGASVVAALALGAAIPSSRHWIEGLVWPPPATPPAGSGQSPGGEAVVTPVPLPLQWKHFADSIQNRSGKPVEAYPDPKRGLPALEQIDPDFDSPGDRPQRRRRPGGDRWRNVVPLPDSDRRICLRPGRGPRPWRVRRGCNSAGRRIERTSGSGFWNSPAPVARSFLTASSPTKTGMPVSCSRVLGKAASDWTMPGWRWSGDGGGRPIGYGYGLCQPA